MIQNACYAVGDIHGCFNTLQSLLFNILKIKKSDIVYFMGDYSDRGPRSREVFDFLIDKIDEGYSFYPLMGNHERMMIDSLKSEDDFFLWQQNGAIRTLRSFHTDKPSGIPEKYFRFIESLRYYFETNEFVLTHAGLNCFVQNPFEDKDFMLWTKEFSFIPEKVNGKKLIIGHRPTRLTELLTTSGANVVKTDGGCVYTDHYDMGNLIAFDMNSKKFFVHHNCENNES